MTRPTQDIAEILLNCEKDALAPPYVSDNPGDSKDISQSVGAVIPYESKGGNIFVVSDLHLATGLHDDGRYDGCENFFSDHSFRRFLRLSHETSASGKSHVLIINGDFIDFLRVTYVPGREKNLGRWQRALIQFKIRRRKNRLKSLSASEKEECRGEFAKWQKILERIGVHKSIDELVESITDKEELYGLKTHNYKSVLRLDVVIKGHPEFFEALADWLELGNRLVIVKGNHDLEWYWIEVRNYLRYDLARRIANRRKGDVDARMKDALIGTVLPGLTFVDHALVVDEEFYIEHGHPYDALTRVVGDNTIKNEGGEELNIPFGSFFNRYMLNFVELDYPFLDNIRPTPNILPLMFRQNFFGGLRLLYNHLSVIVKTVPRSYVKLIFGQNIIGRALLMLLALIVPPAVLIWHQVTTPTSFALIIVEWLAVLAAVYAIIQALSYAQLKEPDSLAKFARLRLQEHSRYRLITFGHTHNPDQFKEHDRWFYNTGTWIPIVETTTADIRVDRTFTFLRLGHDKEGRLKPGVLERWDDEAARTESIVLIKRGAREE